MGHVPSRIPVHGPRACPVFVLYLWGQHSEVEQVQSLLGGSRRMKFKQYFGNKLFVSM